MSNTSDKELLNNLNQSDKELLNNLNQSDKINSLVACRFLNEYGRELISFEVDGSKFTMSCDEEDEISESELLELLSGRGAYYESDLPDEDGREELKKLSMIESPDEKKRRQSESQERTDLRRLTNAEETGDSSSEILAPLSPELFDFSVISGRSDYSSSKWLSTLRIIEELSHIEIVREEEIETHTEDHQSQEQS